jgi:hypothetical protein
MMVLTCYSSHAGSIFGGLESGLTQAKMWDPIKKIPKSKESSSGRVPTLQMQGPEF